MYRCKLLSKIIFKISFNFTSNVAKFSQDYFATCECG